MKNAKPRRLVTVEITVVDDKHCDAMCLGFGSRGHCVFFGHRPLAWNRRRKHNGWQRLPECRNSEAMTNTNQERDQ